MKNRRIKLLKLLGITAVIGGGSTLVALTTSCGGSGGDTPEPPVAGYSQDGTNWVGYISGSLTCILNDTNHTCVVSNGNSYVASGLIIPDTIISNRTSYTVVGVNPGCFQSNKNLTGQLTFGNNLTTIGASSFRGCTGLTGQLTFPNGITSIQHDAFYSCTGITGQLTLPSNPAYTTVTDSSFSFMTSITSVVMSAANITSIESSAFAMSTNITAFVCDFASAPTLGTGNNIFNGFKPVGTVQNLNGAYSSATLCALFKTVGLPAGWTPAS